MYLYCTCTVHVFKLFLYINIYLFINNLLVQGFADLHAVFYPHNKNEASSGHAVVKKHILQVSTYQMTLLLLFNKKPVFTFQVRTIIHVIIHVHVHYVIVNTWGGVFYRIYPHELPVESLKIAHEAEGRVRYF